MKWKTETDRAGVLWRNKDECRPWGKTRRKRARDEREGSKSNGRPMRESYSPALMKTSIVTMMELNGRSHCSQNQIHFFFRFFASVFAVSFINSFIFFLNHIFRSFSDISFVRKMKRFEVHAT